MNNILLYPYWAIAIAFIAVTNIVMRFTVFSDKKITFNKLKPEFTERGTKYKFERRVLDIVSGLASWYILGLLVFNTWSILDTNAMFGGFILLSIITYPLGAVGAYVWGIKQGKNKFDDYALFEENEQTRQLNIDKLETFTDPDHPLETMEIDIIDESGKKHKVQRTYGVIYEKAESLKDAWNEQYKALLVASFRDQVWKINIDDGVCKPLWSAEAFRTRNKKVIETYIRNGKELFDCLMTAVNDVDLRQRYLIVQQNAQQEDDIVKLEEENHLLRSQRKKGVQLKTADRIGVFFSLFEKGAGDTLATKKMMDAMELADEGSGMIIKDLSKIAVGDDAV